MMLVCAAVIACTSGRPSESTGKDFDYLVFGLESGTVRRVDSHQGLVERSSLPRFDRLGQVSLSRSGRTLYVSARAVDEGQFRLSAIDLSTETELWHLNREGAGQGPTLGTGLGSNGLSLTPDETRLVISATRAGRAGVAAVDIATRSVSVFSDIGEVKPEGLLSLRSAAVSSAGSVWAAVFREGSARGDGPFLVLDPTTLRVTDSLLPPVGATRVGHARRGEDSPRAYVWTDLGYFCVDVVNKAYSCSTRDTTAALSVVAGGANVLLTYPKNLIDGPVIGRIDVLSADLALLRSFALKAPAVPSAAAVFIDMHLRGGRLAILTGTPAIGPLFGPQRTHIVIVDFATGAIERTIDLGEFGGQRLVPLPR